MFTVERVPMEGALLLRLAGKGERKAVAQIQEALGDARHVIFDCAAVDMFDSAAFGFFINLAKAVGSVAFCRVSKRLKLAFELLGIDDLFAFHPNETSALKSIRLPEAQFQEIEEAWTPGPIVLPSWMDEEPATTPLDHPRWLALLQTAVEPETVRMLGARAGLPARDSVSHTIRSLLAHFRSPEDLLASFDEGTLERIGRRYGLKPPWTAAILEHVHRSTAETLASTGDVIATVRQLRPPRTLKTDAAARTWIAGQLARTLGRKEVVRKHADIDVDGNCGLLVRIGSGLLPARFATLLGTLLLLTGVYAKDRVVLVVVGTMPPDLKPWIERIGSRWVELDSRKEGAR